MGLNFDQCGASYPVRKSLTNHKRLKHGDAMQFTCKQSTYVTTKKENYRQHATSLHEKVREMCVVCGKDFSDKPNINKHLRKFHTEIVRVNGTKIKPSESLKTQPERITRCFEM